MIHMTHLLRHMVLAVLATFILTPLAFAKEPFDLVYQKQNRWVATEDATGLRTLLSTAKKENVTNFQVKLPEENRTVTIERLIVLRDILEKQLKMAVTIEEIEGTVNKNHIHVMFKK